MVWMALEREAGVRINGWIRSEKTHICRAIFFKMVEETTRQRRLEGCHRLSAATHLICGLEGV